MFWPGQKVAYDARSWLIRLFLRMRQSAFASFGLGDLISRMSSDVTNLRLMCGFGLLQFANLGFLLGTSLALMLATDVTSTALALAPITALLFVTYIGMPYISRFSRDQQEVLGALSNRVTEAFSNVQIIQVSQATEAFERLVEKENERNLRTSIKLLIVRILTFPFIVLFSGLAEVLLVYFGCMRVISGTMTVGDILAFNVYVGLLGFPLGALGIIIAMQQRAVAALGRLHEIENANKEDFAVGQSRTRVVPESNVLLEFRNVSFSYPVTPRREALRGVSLTLKTGERLGLCGPVGSGKSTLFALATRIYDPEPGSVYYLGQDVVSVPFEDLRRSLRLMTQTVHLFSDSVRANLCFGLEDSVTDSAIEEACRKARIWEDITAFPGGLDTAIGERGVRLSGGQRQRLALARMLLRPGIVMLFDDIVSAVDTRTERGIIDELFHLQRPFIITSHRAATLQLCDRVVYLDAGRVAYEGPYAGMNDSLQASLSLDTQSNGSAASYDLTSDAAPVT
ncbi:MAG: ABC transporter ATP-binding protein, partial [Burkholderiaceae bacterium]